MFTVYDTDKNEFIKVEEPDPSLNYTYADYLKWNFEERLELIRGRIFKMSPAPAPIHQEISGRINALFLRLLTNKKCKVYAAPFDVRLPVKNKKKDEEITTVVQPDISVICDQTKIDGRGCLGAPDLVIEILSPGNNKKDLKVKPRLYQESGISEYWVVFPVEESVIVFNTDEMRKYYATALYTADDIIYSKTITGFEIQVNDIFTK